MYLTRTLEMGSDGSHRAPSPFLSFDQEHKSVLDEALLFASHYHVSFAYFLLVLAGRRRGYCRQALFRMSRLFTDHPDPTPLPPTPPIFSSALYLSRHPFPIPQSSVVSVVPSHQR